MQYIFEDCAFDVGRRELRRGTEIVPVPPQVFDLLEYLIRNRERVVGKDELIDAVWDGRIVSDAALTTRLNVARAAIGDSGQEQRLIKTLTRKGLRFVGRVREVQHAAANRVDAPNPARVIDAEPPVDGGSPLPDKPSIAVLPFDNMSGDPEQDYFGDGLVDDIITALSRFRALFVIARNSSFTYKGKTVDIKQVGRELGVRYVLEGSVRKAGSRLRITGQLIDAATGAHLWADRFDGALDDIFDLQDRVTQQVVGAIAPELDRAEIERAGRRPTTNTDAVTAYYLGSRHLQFPNGPQNNDIALSHFERAITLDPDFAAAYGGAAACLAWRRANYWPGDIKQDNARLSTFAEHLRELHTDDAYALSTVGFNLFWCQLDYDGGLDLVERAAQANPNYARAFNFRGLIRGWYGESDTAIADLEHAMRLSPRDVFNYNALLGLALAHHNAGRHAQAAEWTDKALRAFPPSFLVALQQSILCYVAAGRLQDAQRLMTECLRRLPRWRQKTASFDWIRSPQLREEMLAAFIAAGLPE